ncbi:MAG: hypothetical protein AAF587_25680 [Bacteroidota bacterium]
MMNLFCPICLITLLALGCQPIPPEQSSQEAPFLHTVQQVEVDTHITEAVVIEQSEPDKLSQAKLDSIHLGYRQLISRIKAQKAVWLQQYHQAENQETQQAILQEARSYLLQTIPDELLPYWYGTPWDFNGYSNHPREGIIACGYFVSTPLKHIGFPINRYRVAQQAAAVIVDTLCSESYSYNSSEKLFEALLAKPDELYIVGLDYHVGFLLKRGEEIDFIHSSYYDPVAVVKEEARKSLPFLSSNLYVVGPLLTETGGLSQWFFAK